MNRDAKCRNTKMTFLARSLRTFQGARPASSHPYYGNDARGGSLRFMAFVLAHRSSPLAFRPDERESPRSILPSLTPTQADLSFAYPQYAANITYSVSTSTFLIMSSAVLSEQNRDVLIDGNEELRSVIAMGGGCTMIFDPEGRELIQKPASDEEVIVYADIDLSLCQVARVSLSLLPLRRLRDFRSPPSASFLTSVWVASLESAMDPSGHYGRSDGEPRPSLPPPLRRGLEHRLMFASASFPSHSLSASFRQHSSTRHPRRSETVFDVDVV